MDRKAKIKITLHKTNQRKKKRKTNPTKHAK